MDAPPSLESAAEFIEAAGLVLLFPAARVKLPSLWDAVAQPGKIPFEHGMGEAESLVWLWKDELPLRSMAWYGKFALGRACLLAPDLLAALYPGQGTDTDHLLFELSQPAHQIAEVLIDEQQPSATLRAIVGRKAYDKGMAELQRNLLVTNAGVRRQTTGWPTALVDLTCRRFAVGGRHDISYAMNRLNRSVPDATRAEIARWIRTVGLGSAGRSYPAY